MTFYSDGYVQSGSCHILELIYKCPYCSNILFYDDLDRILIHSEKSIFHYEPYLEKKLPDFRLASSQDHLKYAEICQKSGDTSKELQIRLHLWHGWNGHRDDIARKNPPKCMVRKNLLRLIAMLEEYESHPARLLRAEIYRHLGKFEQAIRTLGYPSGYIFEVQRKLAEGILASAAESISDGLVQITENQLSNGYGSTKDFINSDEACLLNPQHFEQGKTLNEDASGTWINYVLAEKVRLTAELAFSNPIYEQWRTFEHIVNLLHYVGGTKITASLNLEFESETLLDSENHLNHIEFIEERFEKLKRPAKTKPNLLKYALEKSYEVRPKKK